MSKPPKIFSWMFCVHCRCERGYTKDAQGRFFCSEGHRILITFGGVPTWARKDGEGWVID